MLALALGGASVAEWQSRVSRRELLDWIEFYRRWPFDDLYRYHRPAALIAHRVGRVELEAELDYLHPPTMGAAIDDDVDLSVLRALGVSRHRG